MFSFQASSEVNVTRGTDDPPKSIQVDRSEEHTSELQSRTNLVCRLLLEKKKIIQKNVHLYVHDPFAINNYAFKLIVIYHS